MVHTPRTHPPPELLKHGRRWAARFEALARGDWATHTAKKALGAALHEMAHGKCVYCEGTLGVQSFLQIEHYVAKRVSPGLVFEWTNLLPACQICNNAKGEQDHGGALLKPDAEDPEPYFWIHPDTGKLEAHPKLDDAQSRRASETIRLCDLQRAALCVKRVEMMERVRRWLSNLAGKEWEALSSPALEYKLVLRHVLVLSGLPALAEFDRAKFRLSHLRDG